ncbi:MAG: hypothetical protein KF852_10830 [Saprospiraceae bacterium]|nr:hypothetical protein [Saprospiraceae bacterium]
MTALEIVLSIYREFISRAEEGVIPIDIRAKSIIGTVQDDPFDHWVGETIKIALPGVFEVFQSGSLTTPDLVIRDPKTGTMVGIEIKKLIQKPNGSDSRGLTIDYNSCLPCGSTLIRSGVETIIVPCFYLFALLDSQSKNIVTLIFLDGDFLNYDFELHKESKYSNYTEYFHGPYGEGSVRHRKMYTYPNPINSKISAFHLRHILIAKKSDFEKANDVSYISEQIIRTDKYGNSFYYYLKDETANNLPSEGGLRTLTDVFDACKQRSPKERTAAIPLIPALKRP